MQPDQPPLTERFASILRNLSRVVAARMALHPADQPILMVLWRYLQRRSRQFARLAERVRSGTLPPPRPLAPLPAEPRPRKPPGLRLPFRLGWLCPLVPGSAVHGCHLQALLADPEMAALLEAAPQAARILRPLLRMLGAEATPDLLPPPPPRRRRPPQGGASSPGRRPALERRSSLGPRASGPPSPAAALAIGRATAPTAPPRSPGKPRRTAGKTMRLGSFLIRVPD